MGIFIKGNDNYIYEDVVGGKLNEVKILPPEICNNMSEDELVNLISACILNKKSNSKKRKVSTIVDNNEIKKVVKKIQKNDIKFTQNIFSEGGSRSSSEQDKTNLKDLRYWAMELNDIVILEPIGNIDNATYVAVLPESKNEEERLEAYTKIAEELKNVGRKEAITNTNNSFYKITHNHEKDLGSERVRYSTSHILKLLGMSIKHPEELKSSLKLIKERNSYNLADISEVIKYINEDEELEKPRNLKNSKRGSYSDLKNLRLVVKANVLKNVVKSVKEAKIPSDEILSVGRNLIEKDKIIEEAKDNEGVSVGD